jgi:hypothetical protein
VSLLYFVHLDSLSPQQRLTRCQTLTVQIQVDRTQALPSRDVLLPKIKALREVLQQSRVCKRVRYPFFGSLTHDAILDLIYLFAFLCASDLVQSPQSRDLVYYKLVEWMQAQNKLPLLILLCLSRSCTCDRLLTPR